MEATEAKTGFRRILIPVGGRASIEEVLARAGRLLERPDVTVTLLTVIETSGLERNSPEYRADPRHQVCIDRLEDLRMVLAEKRIVTEAQIRFGDPAMEIAREAVVNGHDLIVMATRGRSEIGRFFLGSVAQAVLRLAGVPVLLFRTPTRPAQSGPFHLDLRAAPFRRIFVPLDGTELSEGSLPHALALARDFDSEICLSTAVPDSSSARAHRKAAAYIDMLLERSAGRGPKVTGEVLRGSPDALMAGAPDRGFDTIAMATHGRAAFPSFLWGSETVNLVSKTSIPVLAVRGRRRKVRSTGPGRPVGAPAGNAP